MCYINVGHGKSVGNNSGYLGLKLFHQKNLGLKLRGLMIPAYIKIRIQEPLGIGT